MSSIYIVPGIIIDSYCCFVTLSYTSLREKHGRLRPKTARLKVVSCLLRPNTYYYMACTGVRGNPAIYIYIYVAKLKTTRSAIGTGLVATFIHVPKWPSVLVGAGCCRLMCRAQQGCLEFRAVIFYIYTKYIFFGGGAWFDIGPGPRYQNIYCCTGVKHIKFRDPKQRTACQCDIIRLLSEVGRHSDWRDSSRMVWNLNSLCLYGCSLCVRVSCCHFHQLWKPV